MSRLLAIVLLFSGCAYQQAMREGNKLAAAGDWPAAYEAYSRAVETNPKKTDAQAARTLARDEATGDALDEAEAFLELREYEKCAEKLTYVESIDDDRPEVFAIRTDLAKAITADYQRTWEEDRNRVSYELAVLASRLVPTADFLPDALKQCRDHFTAEAKRLLKKAEHEEALAAIRTISELEPDRKGDVTGLEHEILIAWADAQVKLASAEAKAKRYGAGAVLYARAYEIAGRRPDIDHARDLAGKLREDGQFTVRITYTGSASRTAQISEFVDKGIVGISDAVQSDASSADLTAKVAIGKESCAEAKETTAQTKRYVSGQVEKPNPIWHELTEKRERAKTDEATASQRVAELEPEVKNAQGTLRDFDTRIAAATKTRDGAQAKIDQADQQLRASQELRDQLVQQLDDMRATGGSSEGIAQWEGKLAEVGKRISEWQGVILGHQDAHDAANREVQALEVERGPANEALQRLQSGLDAVVGDRTTAQQAFSTLTTQLASTPKTIWEDVYADFDYTIEDWTRTCKAPVNVAMAPRWEASGDMKREWLPTHDTKDRAHPGHEKAEVAADEKAYPEADEALVAKGDEATAKEFVAWLNKLADDHFKVRTMDTLIALQSDPKRSTTDLVALYVGAPGRLDEQALSTFATHVKQHYGLEKLELLRGASATATAP